MIQAVLFDADGVIVVPPKLFSQVYAEEYGLDPATLQAFFTGEFVQAITGRADLKDLIHKHTDKWQRDRDPQELLDKWFAAEHVIDQGVLDLIVGQRAAGMPVYLATNQEQHRARYFKEVMFPDVFDGMFISSEIGHEKRSPGYWVSVLDRLAVDVPGITPDQIVFFDDSQDSVDGAARAGLNAHLYKHIDQIKDVLKPPK